MPFCQYCTSAAGSSPAIVVSPFAGLIPGISIPFLKSLGDLLTTSSTSGVQVILACLRSRRCRRMSFKKPVLLSSQPSTFICWNCLFNHQPAPPLTNRSCYSPSASRKSSKRTYATVASEPESNIRWPEIPDPQRIPTPYQIFNQKPSDAYSKRRFYELVKIYHPDRAVLSNGSESARQEATERYRLIIAANAILSEPDRRSAYDRMGIGWSHYREDTDMNREKWKHYRYSTYHRWRTEYTTRWGQSSTDGDPMYNATWEDWERWYEKQRDPEGYARRNSWQAAFSSFGRSSTGQVYTNNHVFLSLVAILAALGGVGQATRLNHLQDSRQQRISAVNEKISQDLIDVRKDTWDNAGSMNREDRIKKWVREREGYSEGEFDGRTARLSEDSFCGSGMTKDRGEVPFWKKPPEEWER